MLNDNYNLTSIIMARYQYIFLKELSIKLASRAPTGGGAVRPGLQVSGILGTVDQLK